MKKAITAFRDTGPVEIDIDQVCEKFKKRKFRKGTNRVCSESFISRWHDEYKLCDVSNSNISIKVTISKEDAAQIIDRLGLYEVISGIFNHASTFRLEE